MINNQFSMVNQSSIIKSSSRKYDLEERTAVFAEEIIILCKSIYITPINRRIVEQLIGSGGSIGANYCEATEAESKRDFIHKIAICKKEIKETKHWLRLLAKSNPECLSMAKLLWKEAHEPLLIFSQAMKTAKNPKKTNT